MLEEEDPLLHAGDAVGRALLRHEVARHRLERLQVQVHGVRRHLVADQPQLELEGDLVAGALHVVGAERCPRIFPSSLLLPETETVVYF